jgi:hypothetical protein
MRGIRFVCTLVAFGIAALIGVRASAAEPQGSGINRSLLATIDALVVAMNRSDDRAIAALMTRDVVIMDEVAPYRWTGPNAEEHWSNDDGSLIRKRGVSASHSTRGMPTFVHHNATHAFLTVPLAYDYSLHGKRQHETGLWTIVMVRTSDGWRISLLGFAKTGDTSDATWDG